MAVIFLVLCVITMCYGGELDFKLQQVLMLSRHNIRTPLTANLQAYSTMPWPKFNESVAHLTKKGARVEGYMAEYLSEWLASENFIKGCPKQEEVLIYSNTKPRTRDTAKSFAKNAFQSCNISIYHKEDIEIFDPVFHPIFHNETENFKQQMIDEMVTKLNDVDLKEAYLELNRILDLKNSDICKQNSLCDLSEGRNEVVYEEGEEPNVSGPLRIGNHIVDSFIMSYYEGLPLEEVAWGKLNTDDQWRLLTKITRQDQNVRFNFTSGSKDLAAPLLRSIFDVFRNGNPKLTVLVGHDSNLNTVVNAIGFKEFTLEDQYEPYPIGGKIMFEKWTDGVKNYLKIEYVYQTFLQIRNAERLSLAHPPRRVLLELNHCKVDKNGFCPWDDFINFNF